MLSPNPKASIPAFLKVDLKKDGPKLLLLIAVTAVAAYLWTRAVAPSSLQGSADSVSPQIRAEVSREYQVLPLPLPPVRVSGPELLISYVPISRSNPFDPLVKDAPTAQVPAQGTVSNDASAEEPPVAVGTPRASVPEPARGLVPVVPKALGQAPVEGMDAMKVRAIGEASGVFSAVIQAGDEAVLVSVGDVIVGGVKVKAISSAGVTFQRGARSVMKHLEEGAP